MRLLVLLIIVHAAASSGLGGFNKADIDYDIIKAVKKAEILMNNVKAQNGTDNGIPLQVKEILSAEKQVVAGVNYRVLVKVNIDGEIVPCNIIISHLYGWREDGGDWSVATGKEDRCSSYVTRHINKRHVSLLGGENAVDADDAVVQQAAQWAMVHINKMSNSLFMQNLLKINHVTKQIVNGLRYHLFLTTISTSCLNKPENHHKTLSECPVADIPKPQDCDVSVIFSQGDYSMQNFKCKPHKAIIGGDDHDYVEHGKDMVKHMSIIGGDTHDYLSHTNDKCIEHVSAFAEFKSRYNRLYGSPKEEAVRFKIFCDNMEKVKTIQAVEQGSAKYGATQFADISEEEFKKQYLGFKPPVSRNRQWPQAKIPEGPIPDSWDWRDHDAVTPVKNQGGCGSCWAFSTTGNIEGQWAINSPSKKLLSLSEQELIDCDKIDHGCNGGYMYDAYEAIMDIGGIETESDYKYKGEDGKCQFNKSEVVVTLTGSVNISKDEGEMAAWLYKNGPIAIGINSFPMQFYLWGIAHPWKFFCDPNALDHGVLIVGYGKKGNEPYWIIKNSWGPHWGREGYYYIYRGDGSCGLNTMCSSATVN